MSDRPALSRRCRVALLVVVIFQALHSLEEYATRLYEVFGPARFVSSLFSGYPARGFIIVNLTIVAAGFASWLATRRMNAAAATALAWFWAILELLNGLGHMGLAVSAGGYFPGLATAPLLAVGSAVLTVLLLKEPNRSSVMPGGGSAG